MKILVIRFSAMGDLVLTTPIFRELKRAYPQAQVTLLTSQDFAGLLANNPYLDKVIRHPRQESWQDLEALIASLRAEEYDLLYDAHDSLRSRWIRWRLGGWLSTGKKPEVWRIHKAGWQRTLLIAWKWNFLQPVRSQRERLLAPLQARVVGPLATHTELFPSEVQQQKVKALLTERKLTSRRFIGIGPSASFPGKCWPLEHFQILIEWLLQAGWEVVLCGGASESEPLALAARFETRVHNLAGQLSPLESAALLAQAKLVICNDTSIGHLAEAMGTPAFVIFGPTVQEFGYGPFLPESALLEVALPCRPCTRNGKGACKIIPQRLCLTSLTPEIVRAKIEAISALPKEPQP